MSVRVYLYECIVIRNSNVPKLANYIHLIRHIWEHSVKSSVIYKFPYQSLSRKLPTTLKNNSDTRLALHYTGPITYIGSKVRLCLRSYMMLYSCIMAFAMCLVLNSCSSITIMITYIYIIIIIFIIIIICYAHNINYS